MRSFALRIPMLGAALVLAAGAAVPASAQETSSGGTEATVDRPGLTVAPGALLDRTVRLRGRTEESDAGRPVAIDKQAPDGSWTTVATTMVEQGGTFTALWKTDAIGPTVLRASVDHGGTASAASAPLIARLTVFQPAVASWYGPGLYGRRTACGAKLTKRTVGVAHRTLPCGTLVTLYHRGRTVTAPVIDRGPFVAGRDWDLTKATADAVGLRATARVGFLPPAGVPLRRAPRR